MRGPQDAQARLFFTIDVQSRIRADHPLRDIKLRVDRILAAMTGSFDQAYSGMGRPSVPPERLLKALLLQALYSVRSETQLVERIDTDLLFRWFLDMDPEDRVFDQTAFTHNRPRLEEHGLITAFFDGVLKEALHADLCSEHFSVDGTMIESYVSTKSFQPKADLSDEATDSDSQSSVDDDSPNGVPDESGGSSSDSTMTQSPKRAGIPKRSDSNPFKSRNPEVDFHGKKRTNETHQSRTDPEARLYRKGKGQPAHLAYLGHVLTENRHGLIINVAVTHANGRAEPQAAIDMIDTYKSRHGRQPKTVASDKGYDSGEYYLALESRQIEPHGAMTSKEPRPETAAKKNRERAEARSRMKERQASEGYRLSQRCRKKAEECIGWLKSIGGLSRSSHIGRIKTSQQMTLTGAAFNLVRLRKLSPA